MRLLQLDDGLNFSLADFAEDKVPRYAILSHTWGRDGDEVTYKDIIDGTGSSKAGYDKLRFCAVQAKNDGLIYCWIDTCCIDKTNAAELTESINSMFRWYQNAAKCYVFLVDVSVHTSANDIYPQLRKSRWFTRGWTLQELVAPKCVEFFSQQGEKLGDKKSLGEQIHQITGISVHALRGEPLSHFSIDERMSWAANRTTRRPEDKIYSLLGIFDIHMEAIYGEGEHHASRRLLRELEGYSENHQLSELLRNQLRVSPFPKQPKIPLVNPVWTVPFERNPRFIGRELEMARLEDMLFGKHRTAKIAITGLGGVGKTQVIIELLFRIAEKQKHCSVIWISAVNTESMCQSYLYAVGKLGIAKWESEKANVKRLVQEHLSKESAGQWLLVFDNTDDIDMWFSKTTGQQPGQGTHPLVDYLPTSKQGAVVFTTRDRKIAAKLAQSNVVDIPAMEENAATELLAKYLVYPDLVHRQKATNTLLFQLTYLPLAIVQAAAYINENAISIADYLLLLAEQEEEVIDLLSEEFEDSGRYRNIKNPVATTWLISFDQIRQRDQLAADYLSFMACIEPKDIPQSLLPPGTSRKKEVNALGTLTAYSFVCKRSTDDCFELHRLVHLATRNWLRKEGLLEKSTEKAMLRLEEVFPDHDHHNRTVWRKYLSHASYLLHNRIGVDDGDVRTNLLCKLGRCLYQEGRLKEAETALLLVIKTHEKRLLTNHSETLTSIGNLASTYRKQGRLTEAEALEVQVMKTRKRKLGTDHPDTLTSMANLASTYRKQGQWAKAEALDVQVMETRKTKFEADHPHTLTSMANLASTYRKQGRWTEAEALFVEVMKIRKMKLGAGHPDTLTSMANLASTYWHQGRWTEAEALDVQVIKDSKAKLGVDHPDTLISMANLASTYWKQGRWTEAETLDVQVMETRKTKLGADHPDTLTSMANLASTYWNQNRWKEAEALFIQVIRINKAKVGADHPNTITNISNLASTYWRQGQWAEAEALFVQVMETRKKKLGTDHPNTLTSMNNLAFAWKSQGFISQAITLMENCRRLRAIVLGPRHPLTLSSHKSLTIWQAETIQSNKRDGAGRGPTARLSCAH